MDETRPLEGLRIVDQTDGKGELCGRLLADLGAEVIRVEPPGGAASRSFFPRHDGVSLYFATRNLGKRGAVLDIDTPEGSTTLERLPADADVWLEAFPAGFLSGRGFAPEEVIKRHPRLVATSITGFGQSGPYRDYADTDPVCVALSGMLHRSGVPGKPPVLPPGALAYDVAGMTAAFAVLAALWQREALGRGQHIDLSVMTATAQITDWALPNVSATRSRGEARSEIRAGSGRVYPLYRCADGYVRAVVLSPRQWRAMRAWLGEPPELQEPRLEHLMGRMAIQETVIDPLYLAFFADKTKGELAREGQRRGIPVTPVLHPGEVLEAEHFLARRTFRVEEVAPHIRGAIAQGFFELDGQRLGFRGRAPALGEHDAAWDARPVVSATAPTTGGNPRPPFADLRVLDFGIGGVGVEAGRLFAEYGAEVIKVETHGYPDFMRVVGGSTMSPSFASSNRCKQGLGVNLRTERGLALVKQLVGACDLVIENNATGTLANMGLGFDVLRSIRPTIVLASSQLMGSSGPWKGWIGYGPSTRPAGGMTHLWNLPGEEMPLGSGAVHPDHVAGRVLAVGALAALLRRARTSRGGHVEVAQVEVVTGLLSDLLLQESLQPNSVQPRGNASEAGAPWGVYPCRGEERWCVITVRSDDEWRRLRRALGEPSWAQARELDGVTGRLAARADIDRALVAWTSQLEDREVMQRLQEAGVAAGFMMYGSDMLDDPQLLARGYPQPLEQPGIGGLYLEGPAFHTSLMAQPSVRPAPGLGEHTREICQRILGLPDKEIRDLIAQRILEDPSA